MDKSKTKGFIALQLPIEFQNILRDVAERNFLSVSGVVRLMIGQYVNDPCKFNDLGLRYDKEGDRR